MTIRRTADDFGSEASQGAQSPQAPHRETRIAAAVRDLSRRDFLRRAAGAGVALGISPVLGGCGGDDTRADPPPGKERRTLFFNLSREAHAGRTYYLTGGGNRYNLVPVHARPDVLARERVGNAFLRLIPDEHITHHVEDVVTPTDTVTLSYLGPDIDQNAGTWSMSMVFLQIPTTGAARAYERARLARPSGSLALSAKRRLYGLPAAMTERDLMEERVLVDSADLAAALVGSHPDLMSLEAGSAHSIHSNVIETSIDVFDIARLLNQPTYNGGALPQITPETTNPTGWGTLVPLMNTTPSGIAGPIKNIHGTNRGRIQYQPLLHPDVAARVGPVIGQLTTPVKNDLSLGADVSGAAAAGASIPAGTLWVRRDGLTHVDQSAGTGTRDDNVVMTLKDVGPQNGIGLAATAGTTGGVTTVSLELVNDYVRFLGMYLQFFDDKNPPNLLPLKSIAEYNADAIIPGHKDVSGLDTDDTMFVTMVPPMFTILGIPYLPGSVTPSFAMPASAHTARVLAAGLSYERTTPPDKIYIPGTVMTVLVNYGVTALLCGAGAAAGLSKVVKDSVVPVLVPLAQELVFLTTSFINQKGPLTAKFWEAQGLAMAKCLLGFGAGKYVSALAEDIVGDITIAVFEDEIPVVGWIMLGVSLAAGLANVLETSIELAYSPWAYADDLVFTHDLSVTVQPDVGNSTFPQGADHYQVTALFDDGTPYTQTFLLASVTPPLAPVVFRNVPIGGQVNVSVSFYASTSTPVTLLGKGSTGLVPNDAATPVPPLPIQEVKFPIGATTKYRHKQKTALNPSGARVWDPSAPPPTVNAGGPGCGTAGAICSLHDITVRQGTSTVSGRIGYAWQSQNTNPTIVPSCSGGSGARPLDQLATIDVDVPQSGYGALSCGLVQPGARVAYDLLGSGDANFYLDSTDPNVPIVRRVSLDPKPTYDGPASNRAWGVFHFMPDVLLLHPARHLVSINRSVHKLETRKLPDAPMNDVDAKTALIANVKCGQGTRPGLLTFPVGAVIAQDGTILVVEAGNTSVTPAIPNRIQALDLGGNAVRYFTGQAQPYFLTLDATPNTAGWVHLDIVSEFSGLLYVLSYNTNTFVYRLDIYHPAQSSTTPISTTPNVNAGKLVVDVWRNVYTLNYEPLVLSAPGIVEPSVSLWAPSNSCVGVNCTPTG